MEQASRFAMQETLDGTDNATPLTGGMGAAYSGASDATTSGAASGPATKRVQPPPATARS